MKQSFMGSIKRMTTFVCVLFVSGLSIAQNNGPAMADTMRSSGKIYVVVAVICVIFVGIIALLISNEMKLKKLEEELEANKA